MASKTPMQQQSTTVEESLTEEFKDESFSDTITLSSMEEKDEINEESPPPTIRQSLNPRLMRPNIEHDINEELPPITIPPSYNATFLIAQQLQESYASEITQYHYSNPVNQFINIYMCFFQISENEYCLYI